MNLRLTIVAALGLLGTVSVWADEKLPVLKAGSDVRNYPLDIGGDLGVYLRHEREQRKSQCDAEGIS
jgi:hypothetical protein